MQTYAPIALFTYNRADHTRKAVESLLTNAEAKDSDLFIFSDGPKTPEKAAGVDENRKYIHNISGFKSITIVERPENWGLSRSLIAGITEVTNNYGRVIVVEDDLIVSPFFLQYMNEGLEKYKDEDKVSAISGFLTPTETKPKSQFFLRYFDCWGWATWDRAWKIFNPNANELLKKMRWKKKKFDIGHVGGFYGTLLCQRIGLVNSWAIRFYASSFLAEKLVLFPSDCLCIQAGLDGSGTHCGDNDLLYSSMSVSMNPERLENIPLEESKEMYEAYHKAFLRGGKEYSIKRIYMIFKSFVRRLLGLDFE